MSIFFASLNSGSNGNCYYIANGDDAVFIDAGISCRETEKRMKRLGLSIKQVKAVFISHEHADHILGVSVLARKYQIPVYITQATLQNSYLQLDAHLVMPLQAHKSIPIGGLSITAFPKLHDASDPHSFIVTGSGVTVGVFTDIGEYCEHVRHHFSQCHAAFLEANYDEEMLDKGRYPHYLKRRIRGSHGHLSNMQALELFTKHKPSFMSHLLLSHLSKDNNCPELVQRLFSENAGQTKVSVASRYKESPMYNISNASLPAALKPVYKGSNNLQLSLFR